MKSPEGIGNARPVFGLNSHAVISVCEIRFTTAAFRRVLDARRDARTRILERVSNQILKKLLYPDLFETQTGKRRTNHHPLRLLDQRLQIPEYFVHDFVQISRVTILLPARQSRA